MAEPPHGGALLLRGPAGSAISVATDGMLRQVERCAALSEAATAALAQLIAARALGVPGPVAAAAERAEQGLRRVRGLADELVVSVAAAAQAYERVELAAERRQRASAALLAGVLGSVARAGLALSLLALLANPGLLATAVMMLVAGRQPPRQEGGGVLDWLTGHPEVITSPEFVRLVGLVVTSGDDAVLGLLGVPPGLSLLLGDDALGLTGLGFGASSAIAAGAALGVMRETGVEVHRLGERLGGSAPAGSAERLARVPEGEAQLLLERYSAPGRPDRWIVYVGPTYDFAITGDQPFDMTSNLHAVAGGSPASLRALELALADAGASAGDELQLVGFSQGGVIAARAAESGAWNVVGLESHGAPVGVVDIPEGVRGLTVRHSDDLVPATGGPEGADSLVHVERRAFLPGEPMPPVPAPAHQREAYLVTARMIDQAESAQLRAEVERLDRFGADYLAAGGSLTSYEYRAERTAGVSGAVDPTG